MVAFKPTSATRLANELASTVPPSIRRFGDMTKTPWLTIIGMGEDGTDGLSDASRNALANAKIIMGPPRHLSLLGDSAAELIAWPVPFSDGVARLLSMRGQPVVVLASGDPFWFGAGSVLVRDLDQNEWVSHPAPSSFALAASALGWALDKTECVGLHAAPFTRLRPLLADGVRIIVTLRDGGAVSDLASYLSSQGFGASKLHVLEALGGPRQRVRGMDANGNIPSDIQHPVLVGIEAFGGPQIPYASGRSDDWFDNDGQITKQPVRALTLSALAPCHGDRLLDIGGGSGSISIEFLLSHPTTQATVIEGNPERAERIRQNAAKLGVDRLEVITGKAPDALAGVTPPDVIFIGGGLSDALLNELTTTMPSGTRLVANAVTLESEALLIHWQAKLGGSLMRIEISNLGKIGPKRGWKAAYPLVQWSVTL